MEKETEKKTSKILYFIALHGLLLIYSLGSICSKMASAEQFLSFKFCLFYGLLMFILVVYAVVWQQIIKGLPIVTAYANKAVTVIWGLVWGFLIFSETITVFNIIGAVIIMAGVYLVVTGDE
jgi:drug/metabolite transporter (DMT)-like permease